MNTCSRKAGWGTTAVALGLAMAAGCQTTEESKSSKPMATKETSMSMKPTTMPAMSTETPTAPKPAAADMTHLLTMSEPYFTAYPTAGAAPAGTFASGTKVLVMVPGAMYSKVMSDSGVVAYTGTKGLEPISKK